MHRRKESRVPAGMTSQQSRPPVPSIPPVLPPRRPAPRDSNEPMYVNAAHEQQGIVEDIYIEPDHCNAQQRPDEDDGYFEERVPSFPPPPPPSQQEVSIRPQVRRDLMRHDRLVGTPLPQSARALAGQRPASDHRSSSGSDSLYELATEEHLANRDSGRHTWNEEEDENYEDPAKFDRYHGDTKNGTATLGSRSSDCKSDQRDVKGYNRNTSTSSKSSGQPPLLDLTTLQDGKNRLRKTSSAAGVPENSQSSISDKHLTRVKSTDTQVPQSSIDVAPKQLGFNTIKKKFEVASSPTAMSIFPANATGLEEQITSAIQVKGPSLKMPADRRPSITDSQSLPQQASSRHAEVTDLDLCAWYFGDVTRDTTDNLLAKQQDGMFLVRRSGKGGVEFPYTLCISHRGEVFNIQIGLRGVNPNSFSLGARAPDEKVYHSVPELIQFYQQNPMELFKKGRSAGSVTLTSSPNKINSRSKTARIS